MCILQATRSPLFSHAAFPSEAHQGTRFSCLPSVTGDTWPSWARPSFFGFISGLSGSWNWRGWAPSPWAPHSLPGRCREGWGPPLLQSSGIKTQSPWNLQKVGWSYMCGAIQTRCSHAFLPTLPSPHWSVPGPTGSFSFLYLEPFSTKVMRGEGHTCAAMTCKRLQAARGLPAPPSKGCHVALFSWAG